MEGDKEDELAGWEFQAPPGHVFHASSPSPRPQSMDPTLARLAHTKKMQEEEEDEELMQFLAATGGFQPPPSSMPGCDAHVQMVSGSMARDGLGSAYGQNIGISSYINPLMLGIHGQRPTLVDKYKGGCITFVKAWLQPMGLVVACNSDQQLPYMLLLQYFKQCLDTADQTLLEDMLE